ncbi:MAG: lysophospholipid acyltransferase family protein [Pseudomonadota bacterium]
MTHVRGLLLVLWTYGLLAGMGLAALPVLYAGSEAQVRRIARAYLRAVFAGARVLCGLKVEVRGDPPRGPALVVAKHQSFLDVLLTAHALDRPRFVMKASLLNAPILGAFARRTGCIAIDRSKGPSALRALLRSANGGEGGEPGGWGQLVIFPQGTRVAPGAPAPYRRGAGALYAALRLGCTPAATNTGVFWPRRGIARHPGVAVLEFLAPIEPGLRAADASARMEAEIEAASDRLLTESRRG